MTNIILIGYMGSGKSEVAKALGMLKGIIPLDLDTYIEKEEKKSISQIFDQEGAVYFRKKEAFYLEEVLDLESPKIIALGGGTPCFGTNMDRLKNDIHTTTIYLKTAIDTLTDRLFLERHKRPLLAAIQTKDKLHEFIRKHLFERVFYYAQSDYTLVTDAKNPMEIAQEILKLSQPLAS